MSSPSSHPINGGHYEDDNNTHLQSLLDSARPFLRGELELVDPKLPSLVAVLRSSGAGECWHKLGSFLDHLLAIYRILKLWQSDDVVCRCGLFHSAYSNSVTDLALFEPNVSRDLVAAHVGGPAERLIHRFFAVPRLYLVRDYLLYNCADDSELLVHVEASGASLRAAKEKGVFDSEEPWRKKINSLVPPEGMNFKHKYTGGDMEISRRFIAAYLTIVMADFSEQLFGFQDELFENSNGRQGFSGSKTVAATWPGDGKPGLWMNFVSRLGVVCLLVTREEEIYMEQKRRGDSAMDDREDEDIELAIPPVFEGCTRILGLQEQVEARDLYWAAVCMEDEGSEQGAAGSPRKLEGLLLGCAERNPFIGEPHVVLAQVYLDTGRFEEAEVEAERGLRLMLEWGSPWDKRMPWEGWVSWARVLLVKAKERSWPQNSWGIIRLGSVR